MTKSEQLKIQPINLNMLEQMLNYVEAETSRNDWVKTLMAIKSEFGDGAKQTAMDWSATASNFNPKDFLNTWKSIKVSGSVTFGTLIHQAKENGFKFGPMEPAQKQRLAREAKHRKAEQAKAQAIELQRLNDLNQRATEQAYRIIELAQPAPPNHPYLQRKQIDTHGILYGSVLSYGGALIIPIYGTQEPFNGEIQNVQSITNKGGKYFLKGGKKTGGYYPIQWVDDAPIVICEGFATGATLAEHYTPFSSVICAFDAGNLLPVAKAFKRQYPTTQIIIAGDNDHHTERTTGTNTGKQKAIATAKAIDALVSIPEFEPHEFGSDWNDRHQLDINQPYKRVEL